MVAEIVLHSSATWRGPAASVNHLAISAGAKVPTAAPHETGEPMNWRGQSESKMTTRREASTTRNKQAALAILIKLAEAIAQTNWRISTV